MPSPPSTRPNDARGRRSSAFIREDTGKASGSPRAHHLPWNDTIPPRVITDANMCRAAARAYLHDSLRTRPDSTLAAGVVLAGGLYFVQAWPLARGGEWVLTAVLDRNLRWVIGLAN